MKADIEAKLADGRLCALGYLVRTSGRDPDEGLRQIPSEVFGSRRRKVDMRHDRVEGAGLTFVDVRVAPRYEMPDYPKTLYGLPLVDCFRLVVLEDWLYHEIAEPVLERIPFWQASYEELAPRPLGNWPVRIEGWPSSADIISRIKYPIPDPQRAEQIPPDEVVAIRRRVDDQLARLIQWLRDGTLPAEGIKEPKEDDPRHVPIPTSWWSPEDVEVNFRDGSLWVQSKSGREMKFSEIRILAPQADTEEAPVAAAEEKRDRPKGKRGRKPKWDWKAATREMMRLAKTSYSSHFDSQPRSCGSRMTRLCRSSRTICS